MTPISYKVSIVLGVVGLALGVTGVTMSLYEPDPKLKSVIVETPAEECTPCEVCEPCSCDYSVTPLEATTPWTKRIEYIKQVLTIKANQKWRKK